MKNVEKRKDTNIKATTEHVYIMNAYLGRYKWRIIRGIFVNNVCCESKGTLIIENKLDWDRKHNKVC